MLKVFDKIVDLQNQLFEDRKQGKEIGLVPTMVHCMKDTPLWYVAVWRKMELQ